MASLKCILEHFLGTCVRVALARERPLVIGVAGSVGKSSTKEAIGIALGAQEAGSRVVASTKNYNNELGLPLTVFGCEAPGKSLVAWLTLLLKGFLYDVGFLTLRASTFVLEMGTDRPGDLAYLLSIAPPSVGVLTAIGPEHMEYFGTLEAVAREEGGILRALKDESVAVTNADDRLARTLVKDLVVQHVSFGASEDATARILECRIVLDEVSPASSGLDVTLSLMGCTWQLRLVGTVGRSQVYAVAAALAAVSAIDGDERLAIARIQKSFHGMPGRMRLLEGVKRTWLIDDSYNAQPPAVFSAIRDLASFPIHEGCRRIAALGDMLELGQLAEATHRDVGRSVAETGVDFFVTCGTFAHVVAHAARDAGMSEDRIATFATSVDAGRFLQDRIKQGDVVLIKGSQGARMERVTKELLAHPEQATEFLVRQSKQWEEK